MKEQNIEIGITSREKIGLFSNHFTGILICSGLIIM
jgi:hypothetical protein